MMFDQQLLVESRNSDIQNSNSASKQQRSGNRISKYSEERWVDVKDARQSDPIPFEINKYSELSQNQFSQKSYNNFTFYEKQTSKKDQSGQFQENNNSKLIKNMNSQSQDTLAQIKL